jgi:ribonuclease M5
VGTLKYGFIVEGFNDEKKLRRLVPSAYFVVTNGTRMNNRLRMNVVAALALCDELFILTDPDESGSDMAKMLLDYFPDLRRIELEREHCLCYLPNRIKVGVEHCSLEYLRKMLSPYLEDASVFNISKGVESDVPESISQ